MERPTGYATIGMLFAIAKKMALRYGVTNIQDIQLDADNNGIKFVLTTGDTVTVPFDASELPFIPGSSGLTANNIQDAIYEVKEAIKIPCITGVSDPTTATVGEVGQAYLNTTTKKEFVCMAVNPQGTNPETYTYSWEVPSNLLDTSTRTQELDGGKLLKINYNDGITIQAKDNYGNYVAHSLELISSTRARTTTYTAFNSIGFNIDGSSTTNNDQKCSIRLNNRNVYLKYLPSGTTNYFTYISDLFLAFSTATNYEVGNLVSYLGHLYKCTTAHTGAWNAADFTEVTVADILNEKANANNVVTLDTTQTITGVKTFDNQVTFSNSSAQGTNDLTIRNDNGYNAKIKMGGTENMRLMTGGTFFGATAGVTTDNSYDLGASSAAWKDLYLKGKIALDNYIIDKDQFGQLQIGNANATSIQFDGSTIRAQNIVPIGNNQKDLGSSSMKWKDLYLAGNLSDGTNSISIANIADKSSVPTAMTTYQVEDVVNNSLYTCYNITTTVTNGTYVGNAKAPDGVTAKVVITPDTGYELPSSVTVTNATSTYDNLTGEITITNPTGVVTVTVVCTAVQV